jgi:pimeloyl-ACP methyl ester carboxylesterase
VADITMSDGIPVHVRTHGPPARRQIVLTHGFASSSEESWVASGFVDALTAAGWRVVTWDMRGHGRSGRPVSADAYGDDRLAADLAHVVGAAASRSVLVGYSMGAAVTLHALAAGLRPTAAVIGAAAPAVLRWTADDEEQRRAAVDALRAGRADSDVLREWIDGLEATGASRLALAALLESHRPVVRDFSGITLPVTVVAGRDDGMAADPIELADRLPDARAVELAGDHLAVMLSEEFCDLVVETASRAASP